MADDAPEVLTEEQEEAALQALLDKADQKMRPDPVEPAPDKLEVEPEPVAEPAKEPDTKDAEPAEKSASTETSEPKEPAKEPAKEPSKAALSEDDEALVASVPEGAHREAVRERLTRAAALQVKAAKLEHDNRSMAGRVSAFQARYEEATGKRPAPAAPAVTAEQKQEWKDFQSEYPEIAKAIEARFAEVAPPETAAHTQQLLEYVEEQKRNAFLQDAWAAIDAVHPDWRADGRTEGFKAWKASSATYEKLAASDDISDAIALFDLYEAHKSKQPKAPAAPAPASTAAADQVAARREKQAEGAVTPSGRAASPDQSVDLNDPDQLFAFYAKNADSRMKRRHL